MATVLRAELMSRDTARVKGWCTTTLDALPVPVLICDFSRVIRQKSVLQIKDGVDFRARLQSDPRAVRQALEAIIVSDLNDQSGRLLDVPSPPFSLLYLFASMTSLDFAVIDLIVAIAEGRNGASGALLVKARSGDHLCVTLKVASQTDPQDLTVLVCVDAEFGSMSSALKQGRVSAGLEHPAHTSDQAGLPGWIAHEVCQPLTATMNNARAARRWLDRELPNVAEALTAIGGVEASAQRSLAIVAAVRRLVEPMSGDLRPIQLHQLVGDAVRTVREATGTDGPDVRIESASYDVAVRGDRVLLEQVLFNLLANAARAAEGLDRPLRSVLIRTTATEDQVFVTVEDHGRGFSAEMLRGGVANTGGTTSRGMGLGLMLCQAVLSAHGGSMHLGNVEPTGARVSVLLPRHKPRSRATGD